MCMFYKLGNFTLISILQNCLRLRFSTQIVYTPFWDEEKNLANIAIPPILVPSVKHNCHYNHIKCLNSDAFKYNFFCQRCQTLEYYSLTFGN